MYFAIVLIKLDDEVVVDGISLLLRIEKDMQFDGLFGHYLVGLAFDL